MRPTRRLWAALALAGLLSVLAVLIARPVLLAGASLIGAWVVTQQYRFLRALEDTTDGLQVSQTAAATGARTGETTPVTLVATHEPATPLTLEIDAGLPPAATADTPLSLVLEAGDAGAERTVAVDWPVTGEHRFDEPTITAGDDYFRETLAVGSAPTVTVEPRGPRAIHVGEGGDRIATAYGDREGGRMGFGLEPAELREYVPGDTADRIDWKATARLGTPYVREYEAETNRRTLLVVDHRATLATGHDDETKLDYLRDIALALTASVRRLGDPIGLVTVDDAGVSFRLEPARTPATYDRIRRRLLDLEVTPATTADSRSTTSLRLGTRPTAASVRQKLGALDDADGAFSARLQPFYATREGYRERIDAEPLYAAVRTSQRRGHAAGWTVIVTDDSRPTELRETVKLARTTGDAVLVLLAPTVLYEPGGLADVERAYERYLEFERLRRDLARLTGVTALEVGPQDRLSTVLSAGRTRRRGEAA
ncbi:DUF58 domain-containing protein [Natronorubrum tibetense]|uniref:DUF58 domain-containing protein n=1 Tax=Natronorubrum tibetense GA33 TaxID=1114856 RepID=L9VL54_9EURY|nr:DUF58 domain-containing protein [Natronorubrum tibetense]ELY37692.1 hypothetical protein C496_19330 [Natronorubrum tibetense GA33]